MRRLAIAALVAATASLACAAGATAQLAPGFTELESVSSSGVQGNQDSEAPAVSADGRFVAFASFADNLVPGDTNGAADIFVRDRLTGTTERVSVSGSGRQADGNSGIVNGMGGPSISADGRYVAFDSEATNLVKGDTNGVQDVFVRDRLTGATERASVSSAGTQGNGDSTHPAISDDGSRVGFGSFADNLVQPDTNFSSDVFVRDRTTGETLRVSDAPDGAQGNNWSFSPDLNGNGHIVVFDSFASNLGGNPNATVQVFLRDLDTGATEAISAPPGSTDPLERSANGRVSPDGRFVVFDSQASDLLPQAVVLLDRATGSREIESVNDRRMRGNDNSSNPALSSDARFVAFTSIATNLVSDDANFRADVFVRDRVAGTTRRVSVGSNGEEGDLDSIAPAIDADGRVIAFSSRATTLVPETFVGFFASDVFVRDARPAADLSLALADSPDPATTRGDLTYTATTANGGPTNATGVTLVADLPADASFVSATGAACTRGGKGQRDGVLTCNIGALAAGSSSLVTIVVRPARVGTLSLTARVYADQPDPNRANNAAAETTVVSR